MLNTDIDNQQMCNGFLEKLGTSIKKPLESLDEVEYKAAEWKACQENPFYFIYNYVYLEETGGRVKITKNNLHPKMKRVVRSVIKHKKCVLMASRQLGKALALDTLIPLASGGYTTIGEINVGDQILDGNGYPTEVIATTEVMYNRPCYKITFDNGEQITADENHLWKVSNSSKKFEDKILSTKEIFEIEEQIKNWKNPTSCRIKLVEHINYDNNKILPVHPYILGLWLGDGSTSDSTIACHQNDYPLYKKIFENSMFPVSRLKYQYKSTTSGCFNTYGLHIILRQNNLLNNKHIPEIYLTSSLEIRLELLRGLMDSDGYCMKGGTCQFYQKNLKFIIQFRQLLNSLGIKSKLSTRVINDEEYHALTFTTSKYRVFNLERKYKRQEGSGLRRENFNVYFSKIEKVESVPVRCIQVSNSDGMFLCGHEMIPTHNSSISACLISWAMIFSKKSHLI